MRKIIIPSLESERLILEPLSTKFISKNYLEWMQDPETTKYMESGGLEYSYEMLTEYLKKIEDDNILSWAIIIKSKDIHIGNIKIDPIDYINLIGEYGILIGDKKNLGLGYAKEASLEVINFCFNNLFLKQINLGVKKDNLNAIKLYKNIGFNVSNESYKDQNKSHIRMNLLK